jgi:Protein of unknown function (DUF2851)
MTEKILQFIWKHRYFNQQGLELITGESVLIEFPGEENIHQGPDFVNARIRINENLWVGSVELHLFSSGWTRHNHTDDENYLNVVLHVVWKKDGLHIKRDIPQLELCDRIPGLMLKTYENWMSKPVFIPCELSASKTETKKWEIWAARLLVLRLNRKMQIIQDSLSKNQYHWEEQLWWMIASNFGGPVNSASFEAMARSIPLTLIAKHRQQFIQLEALFLGQANLLGKEYHEPYPLMLKKEFLFLKKKYKLKNIYESVHLLRMRPENFPLVRLSQLASLSSENSALFAWILNCDSLFLLKKKLMVKANDYWNNHYMFEKRAPFREKILGTDKCNNIIINSIIPLLYTYGKLVPDRSILKKSLDWLEEMPAENNQLLDGWKRIGVSVKRAAGSQALIELKKQFCDQRKCLECEIGKQLLFPQEIMSNF